MSCYVPETCPIIDEVVEALYRIEVETCEILEHLGELNLHGDHKIIDNLREIRQEAKDLCEMMDDIRIANAAIREWGEQQEDIALARKRLLELTEI